MMSSNHLFNSTQPVQQPQQPQQQQPVQQQPQDTRQKIPTMHISNWRTALLQK